jgi:hypothetical protein
MLKKKTVIFSLIMALVLSISSGGSVLALATDDDGVIEVGGIYNADYSSWLGYWSDVPITEDVTVGFVDYLDNYYPWQRNFIHHDIDEEGPFVDNDNNSADGVDLFFFCGHGGEDYIPLVNDQNPLGNSNTVDYLEAQWGETDLEWVMLFACNTLMGDNAAPDNYQKSNGKFAQALDGVHMICGASTSMSGSTYGGYWVAYFLTQGYSVGDSWFLGCAQTQPSGTNLRIIFEEMCYYDPANQEADYIWGTGGTLSDMTPDNDYYSCDYSIA